ncbi:MAG: helix-turn-helix domain-containing protein [Flavobacteriaceae bacterium]|nr:helix-turn-helix domain-containing protein [Flavobacteriaceae bacterium]
MDIGLNIKKIRELKGYSQDYMANQLTISQRQFSRIEKNEVDLNLSRLNDISKLLEVTPSQILGFDEKFIFQNCETVFGSNQNYYAFSEKERELYEKTLQDKDEIIAMLKERLKGLK